MLLINALSSKHDMFSITTTMIDISSVFSHTDKIIAAIDSWTTINFISEGSPRQYNNAKSSNLSHHHMAPGPGS